jgi:hypothetical protein
MKVCSDSVVVQESEPIAAEVDGEVVMLSERGGAYFGLDDIGSEIWHLLKEPRRVGDLCQVLAQRYDADAETLNRDVVSFLDQLLARGLLRVVEEPEADGA